MGGAGELLGSEPSFLGLEERIQEPVINKHPEAKAKIHFWRNDILLPNKITKHLLFQDLT